MSNDEFFALDGGKVRIVKDEEFLVRAIVATDHAVYKSFTPRDAEFSSDEESLDWDADGWEELA